MISSTAARLSAARLAAEDLDRFPGGPRRPGGPFSHRDIVEAEERDDLPAGALDAVRRWGFLDLMISECTAVPVARALSLALERMSLWSSVVKYLVPVSEAFSWTRDAPTWAPSGLDLQLTNEGPDEITRRWPAAVRMVRELAGADARAGSSALGEIAGLVDRVDALHAAHYAAIAAAASWESHTKEAMKAAERHCTFHAIASRVYTWLVNRDALRGAFAAGDWLVACIERLLQLLDQSVEVGERALAAIEEFVLSSLKDDAFFSPAALAELG